jgi:hypothetical protein
MSDSNGYLYDADGFSPQFRWGVLLPVALFMHKGKLF